METTTRTIGTLTAADIGKPVRIEHEGWVHDGTLTCVEHEWPHALARDVRTKLRVVYASGATKGLYFLSPHQPIEVAIEAASDD